MNKLESVKDLINKQKVEYEKPIVLYKENKGFKNVVKYTNYYDNEKVNQNIVLIITSDEFSGNIQSLISAIRKKFSEKKIVLTSSTKNQYFDSNITVINKNSDEFIKILAKAHIIINDSLLPNYFIKKANQLVIQLTDYISGKFSNQNRYDAYKISVQRTLFQTSHILFKNKEEAKTYIDLFNLRGIYKGKIYEEVNIYNSTNKFENLFDNEIVIISKKYTKKELVEILDKASLILSNFFVFVPQDLQEYYNAFEELEYLLIDPKITKEDLNLPFSKIISDNISDLIGENNYLLQSCNFKIEMNAYDKQNFSSGQNIIEKIIKGNEENFIQVCNNKKNIFMYCGGFLNNGITSSAINLSHAIDYNKYNLIILEKGNVGEVEKNNLKRLHPNVNLIHRIGQSNTTLNEYRKNQVVIQRRGYRKFLGRKDLKSFYNREKKRLVNDIKMDIAIDFSGYVPFWTAFFAFSDSKKKVIYQHNDLKSETEKQINGLFKHKYILPRVFSLYKFFDKIVSVSLQTKELNSVNLKKYASYNKFDYVNNMIDFNDIQTKIQEIENREIKDYKNNNFAVIKQLNNVSLVEPVMVNKKDISLVTIGRLSPEKDHHKLFLSLKKVIENYPDIQINLKVIGSGVMEDELKKQISQLGLDNYIDMLGQVSNPYKYLKEADCFILSSNHEGQPMVLLEALALHMPIIATDITGNRSVLHNTNGLLVDNSIEGLRIGIEQFINGEVQANHQFNINEYNKFALSMFYHKVCE